MKDDKGKYIAVGVGAVVLGLAAAALAKFFPRLMAKRMEKCMEKMEKEGTKPPEFCNKMMEKCRKLPPKKQKAKPKKK